MPLVSIIIPTVNRKSLIGFTLDSVYAQKNFKAYEVIVVDDGSSDGTADFITRDYPQVKIIPLPENKGAPFCRNLGLKEAKGKCVLFLDSDDLISDDFFDQRIPVFEKDDHIDGVYGPWECFSGEKDLASSTIIPRHTPYPIENPAPNESLTKRLWGGWFIMPHAILWKRDTLERVGGFTADLIINQDVDLFFKILLTNPKIIGIPYGTAFRRENDGISQGKARHDERKLREILRLRKLYFKELTQKNLWRNSYNEPLSRYLFGFWVACKDDYPSLAEEFYRFAMELFPGLNVRGSFPFRLIGALVGPKKAVLLKEKIKGR